MDKPRLFFFCICYGFMGGSFLASSLKSSMKLPVISVLGIYNHHQGRLSFASQSHINNINGEGAGIYQKCPE